MKDKQCIEACKASIAALETASEMEHVRCIKVHLARRV